MVFRFITPLLFITIIMTVTMNHKHQMWYVQHGGAVAAIGRKRTVAAKQRDVKVDAFKIERKIVAERVNFTLTPPKEIQKRSILTRYRNKVENMYNKSTTTYTPCGIVWSLATVNGPQTDFEQLSSHLSGVGKYRLLWVVHEVLLSVARVRNALSLNNEVPDFCTNNKNSNNNNNSSSSSSRSSSHNMGNKHPIQLTLFADRGIFSQNLTKDTNLLAEARCLFDRIILYDELPGEFEDIAGSSDQRRMNLKKDMSQRLSSRTNIAKVLTLLSTPYEYTMYMDGDTSPCKGFQLHTFEYLRHFDMLATKNPFGYVSTGGNTTYTGSPGHPKFASFQEINGGVMAFRMSAVMQHLWIRVLELVPFFSALGWDQDQAFIRHGLFEGVHLSGLRLKIEGMDKYCRTGFNCLHNQCITGCRVIHERKCLEYGVSFNNVKDFAVPTLAVASTGYLDRLNQSRSRSSSSIHDDVNINISHKQHCLVSINMTRINYRTRVYANKYWKAYKRNQGKIQSMTTSH